jgi:patatin-like phospholipase/acyl hydrolase
MKNVYVFKGGGYRGLLSADIVNKHLSTEIYNADLLCGTSTGSILASGYSIGLKTQEVLDFYLQEGKQIFSPSFWYKMGSGVKLPKYEAKTLEKVLKKVFKDLKLKDCKIPLMINAVSADTRKPKYFKSWQDTDKELYIWEVVKASCSAPTFFAGTILNGIKYVDGGTDSNSLDLSGYV